MAAESGPGTVRTLPTVRRRGPGHSVRLGDYAVFVNDRRHHQRPDPVPPPLLLTDSPCPRRLVVPSAGDGPVAT